MKNLLRRLHLSGNQEDPPDGAHSNPASVKSKLSAPDSAQHVAASSESKSFHGLSGFLTAAKHTLSQAGSIRHRKGESFDASNVGKHEELGSSGSASTRGSQQTNPQDSDMIDEEQQLSVAGSVPTLDHRCSDSTLAPATKARGTKDSLGIVGLERAQTAETAALRRASDQALILQDEELQVRVAMALSVRDDPEAAAIETAKDLSLGSDRLFSNSTSNLLAYRYWKYNILTYDEKVVDGFYDARAVVSDISFETMPSLLDLQETPVSDQVIWDAVLVNRVTDNGLVSLEQKARSLALSPKSDSGGTWKENAVIYRLAEMVANQMGGLVVDPDLHHRKWRVHVANLRFSLGNVVLPLGHLQVGLGRHRALLYKVLADAVGMPCQLVKGIKYMGGDEAAVNIIKMDGGREYIIDLMAAPGTLLPYEASMIPGSKSSLSVLGKELLPLQQVTDQAEQVADRAGKVRASENSGVRSSPKPGPETKVGFLEARKPQNERTELKEWHAVPAHHYSGRSAHRRSPSWTEGIGSPAVQDMKVKDVSQYMMNAAKENPALAQKLHDVLLESGVQAPPDLFNEISPMQLQAQEWKVVDDSHRAKVAKGDDVRRKQKSSVGPGRPPATPSYSSSSEDGSKERLRRLNSVEGLGERRPLGLGFLSHSPSSSANSSASSGAPAQSSSSPVLPAATALSLVHENLPPQLIKRVPVAAAAAATAAVVASSMVVAATKTELTSDPTLDVPVAAAATATAAVVVATSAVVGRRLELPVLEHLKDVVGQKDSSEASDRRNEEAGAHNKSPGESGSERQASGGADKLLEDERVSDKSTGSVSAKSDRALDDVAECEIYWEDLVIGERIGLGSYGEVYRADWHGTEVAVKKFLDQDITGDALVEFGSEVRLMKRMRHPNVVLFMGAVMRPPNLSIVTEFLPRGSLYRLLHRSNSQLDERRRMRMALDVARGMNYLHSSTPMIVHRDLKSPNLLVDKNWVVKVCDFGLSRMKHNTFLSSKSTAGTPEWMAPEVLRNEPSDEKSDVYSFGVILWELATLQQPWGGMNPMQVVGAVGFQHRVLDIPDHLDPLLVRIIRQCWQSDPSLRPSFADIMTALKPLQKPIIQSQVPKG